MTPPKNQATLQSNRRKCCVRIHSNQHYAGKTLPTEKFVKKCHKRNETLTKYYIFLVQPNSCLEVEDTNKSMQGARITCATVKQLLIETRKVIVERTKLVPSSLAMSSSNALRLYAYKHFMRSNEAYSKGNCAQEQHISNCVTHICRLPVGVIV